MALSYDLVCMSHLRWDSVQQRPHHLLRRFARKHRVFFIEEPEYGTDSPRLTIEQPEANVTVIRPYVTDGLPSTVSDPMTTKLIDIALAKFAVRDFVLWYYTPMSLPHTRHLKPLATVFDCMDELSAFRGAPKSLLDRESELLRRADLVFTGGMSLYEAKRPRHARVYPFPSSVDVPHFAAARDCRREPADQQSIPGPRIGFFGVIDERMDLELLDGIAAERPEWQLVMIGPVTKIEPEDLPKRPNIHYLGPKHYKELPNYIAGWDVALLPFARNESTRFISPTKTPEYLAAGKPVVSTSITDVVRPYGQRGFVRIADAIPDFVEAVEASMAEDATERHARVDPFIATMSWDRTWSHMARLIDEVVAQRRVPVVPFARRDERAIAADMTANSNVWLTGGEMQDV